MDTPSINNSTNRKIFPRNLTARADYIVRGNPAGTRPESGVDNSFPGLEFDQRNLEKQFFPPFYFEFHRDDGAILQNIDPQGVPAQQDRLTLEDIRQEQRLYLWAVIGRTTLVPQGRLQSLLFQGLSGLEVWRRIRHLAPGLLAILVGPAPGFGAVLPANWVEKASELFSTPGGYIHRNQAMQVEWAVFVAQRAEYLDEQGVIDPAVYTPGELTRTLCVPWQYDFRDCGCFYWASNKPDVVSSSDGQFPYLNFQRNDRSYPPPPDIPRINSPENPLERRNMELDYIPLIEGAWNSTLPVVLNNRENEQTSPKWITVQKVIEELRYLATVEHALCVEYLYAHYSLNAPIKLPPDASPETKLIFAAADEIFRIAVDEMRHLHWVNEALDLLEQPPVIGRAAVIGRHFKRPFELKPLTPEQLLWFINVEKPSQSIDEGVDGMYVRILTTIHDTPDFPNRDRLIPILKLLIDEGMDHYKRFLRVQEKLNALPPASYVRTLIDPPPGTAEKLMQTLSDEHYKVLLGTLLLSFALGDKAGGVLLKQARNSMFALHEISHALAGKGYRTPFTLPDGEYLELPRLTAETSSTAHHYVRIIASSMRQTSTTVLDATQGSDRTMIERQQRSVESLFKRMHELIEEDKQDKEELEP